MRSSLFPALLGVALSGCLFIPVDSRLQNQNPTYPDGGQIPIDGGPGEQGQNGVVNVVGAEGLIGGGTYSAGDTITLTAVARDGQNKEVTGGVTYSWSVQSAAQITGSNTNTKVASFHIDSAQPSNTDGTIFLTATQGNVNVNAQIGFTVRGTQTNPTVSYVLIQGQRETATMLDTLTLTVNSYDANNNFVRAESADSWTTSNQTVISLSRGNGESTLATAEGPGQATITVSAAGRTTNFTVTVRQPHLASSATSCNELNGLTVAVGQTVTVYGTYQDSTSPASCNAMSGEWSTENNANKFTLSQGDGFSRTITGVAAGTGTLTVNFSNYRISFIVTVTAAVTQNPAHRIVQVVQSDANCSDDGQATGTMGTSIPVVAVIGASMPCNQASGYTFTWSSDNTDSATVEPQSQGSARATISFGSSELKTHIRAHGVSTSGGDDFDAAFEIIHGGF